jgi:hypothetical protein
MKAVWGFPCVSRESISLRRGERIMTTNSQQTGCLDFCSPIRNRYFYGKLLDVFHFELEQRYFNSKRWLLNRLISGYGVVCGQNVLLGKDNQSLIVTPGVSVDRCGHEIIVCEQSAPLPLPPPTPSTSPPGGSGTPSGSTPGTPTAAGAATSAQTDRCDEIYKHLSICYHECQTDPSPALGGDCDTQALCTPGAIRERYSLELRDGKISPASTSSRLQDVISGGVINYCALANYVTNTPCPDPCADCCINLANIRIPAAGQIYSKDNLDVTIRPVVYTNDMLYELIVAWMQQGQSQSRGGKS